MKTKDKKDKVSNQGLVPKLRFPEFLYARAWEENRLAEKGISVFVKDRVPFDELRIESYVSTENILPDYAGVDIASKLPPTGSFIRFKKGDILVSNIRPYLKKVWFATKEGAASNDVIVIRSQSKISNFFLIFLLKNDAFINYVMKGAKGVKMPRGDISLIKKYPIAFPRPDEQQKIADCLSSLDELIVAQTHKLDTLKAHKKGLMQKLFPVPGQTTPTFRFPEFQDAGEWKEKPLNKVFSIFQGFAFYSKDTTSEGTRWLKIADVGIQYMNHSTPSYLPPHYKKDYKKFLVKIDDYVVALTRPILNKQLKMAKVDSTYDGALLNQRVGKLVTGQIIDFVYYLLQTDQLITEIEKSIAGNDPPNLSTRQIGDILVRIPRGDEQQKIADCLSSLDELIAAQAHKLDTLKAHKKGLMQQLFPNPDEVTG